MKKSVAAFMGFAIGIVLVNIIVTAEAKALPLDRTLSFRELALELPTPDDVAQYLWRHFSFEEDWRQFGVEEYWQTPKEFLENKKGDCEDFANFANAIFRMNGIPSYVLNIYGGRTAHTVCVFKENGKYRILDVDEVLPPETESLKDLVSETYPFWEGGAIVQKKAESKRTSVLSHFDRELKIARRFAESA